MAKTIVNTTRRIYWFDEAYILHEITDTSDIFYDVVVLEPVNEGQFRNLYIRTDNYRFPKRWDGEALQVSDLGGLIDIGVIRARTMEINNSHVIFANIAKNGGGPGASNPIDSVLDIIDTVSTIIDAYGYSAEQGYKRFNKTLIWSDINRPEYWKPEKNNQAGDLDYDETGDEIIRVRKLAEFNVVYKESSIWLLINVGLPFVYVKKFVTEAIGLLAVNAIVEENNVHYFVGGDFDIYRFDGVSVKNLSAGTSIKEYIRSRINPELQYATHAYIDIYRKEIQFAFHGKATPDYTYERFDIVYNYETNLFFRKDSVATCGGYFEQTSNNAPINSINSVINTVGTLINDFLSPPAIDYSADIINNISDPIDAYRLVGVPKWKLAIGDKDGVVHLYNETDSFNGADIDGWFETGDEDYSSVSKNVLADHTKMMSQLQLLLDNQGNDKQFEFMLGVRDAFDKKIRWHGPYKYKMDASESCILKLRANGVYHRFRFRSPFKNQYIRILGYTGRVDDYGEQIAGRG